MRHAYLLTFELSAPDAAWLADSFGVPVYYSAIGQSSNLETLTMLIDRGADVNAMGPKGETALFEAATTRNWKAALLLLQRGADWKRGQSVNGLSLRSLIDSYAGLPDEDGARAEVRRFVEQR